MIIKPKVRGFVCITAHPKGCEAHLKEQISYVQGQPKLKNAPKKVLVLGASTGYGLASRVVAAFGGEADTFGVFFERPADGGKPASAGWYNSVAFEKEAKKLGLNAISMNGDAFSSEFKLRVVDALKKHFGPVDCVIYSLAAPRRTNDKTGEVYKSALKPIGRPFTGKTLNTDRGEVHPITLEPATEEEIAHTVKVMGGEDWQDWIEFLSNENLLSNKVQTIAYSYVGPKITWPIYKDGTIGKAKEDLSQTAHRLNTFLQNSYKGHALISVNKAVVTQASSAIPVVPLYVSTLFKIMKERKVHEDCIQQMYRLFSGHFEGTYQLTKDSDVCIRLDDLELAPEIQGEVNDRWEQICTENLRLLTDFEGYQANFLRLFGFGLEGVDYEAEVDVEQPLTTLIE